MFARSKVLLAVLVLAAVGCKNDPPTPLAVQAAASVADGSAPLEVEFTATPSGGKAPLSYAWTFGDQESASAQSPTHVYKEKGTYRAVVTVTDDDKAIAVASVEVLVRDALSVSVDVKPADGAAPLLAQFGSTILGGKAPYRYNWNFGDGESADQPSGSHLFRLPGEFDVSLTVTDAAGATASAAAKVSVAPAGTPVATIFADRTVGVAPLTVAFRGGQVGGSGPMSWTWDFGDGQTASTQDASHVFEDAGTYTVALLVKDARGNQGLGTVTIQVATNEVPVAEIVADPAKGIEPLLVRLTANVAGGNAPLSYSWDIDGDGAIDSAVPVITRTFTAGTQTVTLKVTDANGDSAEASLPITIDTDNAPNVTATATPLNGIAPLKVDFTCVSAGGNLPLLFRWDFGDGEASDLPNPSHTYLAGGAYKATCAIVDANHDVATGSVTLAVANNVPPQVMIEASPLAGIAPLSVSFVSTVTAGNPPFSYSWSFGDGAITASANPTHSYASAGTFTVLLVVTDTDGEKASATLEIGVTTNSIPAVQISSDRTTGVSPLSVGFSANTAGGDLPLTYSWDFGDGTKSSLPNPTKTFATGTYTVKVQVTDANGDKAQDSIAIQAISNAVPSVVPSADKTAGIAPLTVRFACGASGGNPPLTYSWEFGDGATSTLATPSYTYTRAGTFVATCAVTDFNGDRAQGTVSILVDADLAPTISAQASPRSGIAPLNVVFAAANVSGNAPVNVLWDFGDGTTSSVPYPTHGYASPGQYTVVATATDADGDVARSSVSISVGLATPPTLTATATPVTGPAPLQTVFDCSVTGGGNPPFGYHWEFGDGTSSDSAAPTHTYATIASFVAECTVTDSFALQFRRSVTISTTNPNGSPVIDSVTVSNGWGTALRLCGVPLQTTFQLEVLGHDPDGDALQYEWTFESLPSKSLAHFNDPTIANPTILSTNYSSYEQPVIDMAGDYVVRVRLRDGKGGEATLADPIVLTVRPASSIVKLSPLNPPAGGAAAPYGTPLVARVENSCGAPVAGAEVEWSASNAFSTDGRTRWTVTSAETGELEASVRFGCSVTEPATIVARFTGAAAGETTFVVPVGVGAPRYLLLDAAQDVPVALSDGTPNPMSVSLSVVDQCMNAATSSVPFSLAVEGSTTACFGAPCPGSATLSGTTTGGVFRTEVFDTTPETVKLRVSSPLLSGALTSSSDDFEADGGSFASTAEWAWGEPSTTSHSGTHAWKAVLTGTYQADPTGWHVHTLTSPQKCWPTGALAMWLSFWQKRDLAERSLGYVSLASESPMDALPTEPPYDAQLNPIFSPYFGMLSGWGGASGWTLATADLKDLQILGCGWIHWNLFIDGAATSATGWTVDDVTVTTLHDSASRTFVPPVP